MKKRQPSKPAFRVQCPKCHHIGMSIEEPTMHGDAADGPLIFWRCGSCNVIFSRLTGKLVEQVDQ